MINYSSFFNQVKRLRKSYYIYFLLIILASVIAFFAKGSEFSTIILVISIVMFKVKGFLIDAKESHVVMFLALVGSVGVILVLMAYMLDSDGLWYCGVLVIFVVMLLYNFAKPFI